jgi:hypothetical protein
MTPFFSEIGIPVEAIEKVADPSTQVNFRRFLVRQLMVGVG